MCQQILIKVLNTKFHENPPGGSRRVPFGQTGKRTDTTKLMVTLRLRKRLNIKNYMNSVYGLIVYLDKATNTTSGKSSQSWTSLARFKDQ
jgi:thiamine pyrophosphokinase